MRHFRSNRCTYWREDGGPVGTEKTSRYLGWSGSQERRVSLLDNRDVDSGVPQALQGASWIKLPRNEVYENLWITGKYKEFWSKRDRCKYSIQFKLLPGEYRFILIKLDLWLFLSHEKHSLKEFCPEQEWIPRGLWGSHMGKEAANWVPGDSKRLTSIFLEFSQYEDSNNNQLLSRG